MARDHSQHTVQVFSKSGDFFDQLTKDVKNAEKSVLIQCMSFEADSVGEKLISLLKSRPGLDRKILIDSYSKFVVNDTFLWSPAGLANQNNALKERIALTGLLREARAEGIQISFSNPMLPFLLNYPARNHKKLVVVDNNISYVGGLNFTEHNFAWADLMFRHKIPLLAETLTSSFQSDWNGKSTNAIHQIDDQLTVYLSGGKKNKQIFNPLIERIHQAKKVIAVSPYISWPVLDAVAQVENNRVILPKNNNKGYVSHAHNLKRYSTVNYEFAEGEMLHMKLLILDDETVIYGSANFDTISYLFEQEIIIEHHHPKLAGQLLSEISTLTLT
jgi:cardiolipin synthase